MAICYQSSIRPISITPSTNLYTPKTIRCNLSFPSKTLTTEPQPVFTSVKSFAPATIANLGPGFDFLGCAIDGIGDYVSLRIYPDVHLGEILMSFVTSVKSFAPATVANLGPRFDFLGCAVDGNGDCVSLRIDPDVHPGEISISDIIGFGNSAKKLR